MWSSLGEPEREAVWERFRSRFRFRPHTLEFPGFDEPAGSVTFSVAGMFGAAERAQRIVSGCQAAFLEACRALVPPDDCLLALDWQHPAYRFLPHAEVETDEFGDWLVPLLPDGDYVCFVAPDLSHGTLGHPWEQTLCVFGDRLIAAVETRFTGFLGLPIRRSGRRASGG
jgi:hypothetical protein